MPSKTKSVSPAGRAVAYSYLRFSSPEQSKGDSFRRQTELRDAWLRKTGVALADLTFRDEGRSAFTGAHRENPDRNALAAFLDLVRRNKIARGSYLIVESLDRLSREHIRPALTLLLNLIESGIRIVQLLPAETVYDEHVEPMNLMMAIMELSRGHSESRMKSERSGAAWAVRKQRAREGKVLTRMTPPWLRVVKGEYVLVESAAAAIRRIYQLARDGHGATAITKKLNAAGIANIGKAGAWQRSYVNYLLSTRKVLSEFQPHFGRQRNNRKPDGPPIPNFFPAVISEDEWHATRFVRGKRKRRTGRIGKSVNLFLGLLRDARDGGAIHRANKASSGSKKKGYVVYASARAENGEHGARYVSFPVAEFEAAVLSKLKEIDPREVLPRDNPAADRVLSLAGRVADIESRIEKIKAAVLVNDDIGSLIDVLRTLEGERKTVAADLEDAKREAASPLSRAWSDCGSLLDVLAKSGDQIDARTRLRSALRRIVSEVWCLFVAPGGRWRIAAVQIWFEGGAHRDYLILFRSGCGNVAHRTDRQWWVKSFAEANAPGQFDLRDRKHAAKLEKVLANLDTGRFE